MHRIAAEPAFLLTVYFDVGAMIDGIYAPLLDTLVWEIQAHVIICDAIFLEITEKPGDASQCASRTMSAPVFRPAGPVQISSGIHSFTSLNRFQLEGHETPGLFLH